MRQLAPFSRTSPLFGKIRAFPNMLLVAVQASFTIPQHRKITAHPLSSTHVDVRERASLSCTPALVQEVQAKWRPFRRRVMRQVACFRRLCAVALQKVPADCNFRWIMLIHACQTTATGTCSRKPWTRLVRILLSFRRSSPARWIRSSRISKCHIPSPTARFRLVRPPARDKVARFPDISFLLLLLSMVRSLGWPT